ncbi:hypothetical protein D8674_017461 [Pyrus ussuriensis x Pyrus communis]|uniref:Uncharacterized protein n=1 Tax=Pyrus ussuriensis x Pyrus communis TaxID=2448454 RepID=A0A5N5HHY2_9ROSA|nr:hypothetical protein D8674_017461 [Pyrus ussuriensis x Pyrus communis]
MADSREGSGKNKVVVQLERYRRKQVPYFEGKKMAEAYAEFKYDIGNLVRRDCSAEFESWKKKNTWGPCQQLKTAKVTWVTNGRIPIGYDELHRAEPTVEQHSALAYDIGHVMRTFCLIRWKSWKAIPEETKNTVRNQLSISSFAFLMFFILKCQCLYKPSVPLEYISPVFLHHHPHNLSTPSKHNNQARRPPTLSSPRSKILQMTFL